MSPLASERASAKPGHLGGAGFVDEDEAVALATQPRLVVPPGFTHRRDFGTILFRHQWRFYIGSRVGSANATVMRGAITTPRVVILAASSVMVGELGDFAQEDRGAWDVGGKLALPPEQKARCNIVAPRYRANRAAGNLADNCQLLRSRAAQRRRHWRYARTNGIWQWQIRTWGSMRTGELNSQTEFDCAMHIS